MIVAALPSVLCELEITEAAQFCLDVASQDNQLSEIWILGGGGRPNKALAEQYPHVEIKHFNLDKNVWPLDVGSNQILELPLTLFQAYQSTGSKQKIESIYVPLHSACGYYLHMAKNGGLIADALNVVTACFLPRSFEISASLILPTQYNDVVTCEMEQLCARYSQELWVTDETVIASTVRGLSLDDKTKLKVYKSSPDGINSLYSNDETLSRHLMFCGPLNPIYGIDAFCDLIEMLDGQNKLDTVTIFSNSKRTQWSKNVKERLTAVNASVSYRTRAEFYSHITSLQPGVLICPMRAPVMPRAVRWALDHGAACLYGQGFNLALPNSEINHLVCTVSDARKLAKALDALGAKNNDSERLKLQEPRSIAKVLPRASVQNRVYETVRTVSVILIHHNRLDTLCQALESLTLQSFKDFELIIIDDGSTSVSEVEIRDALNGLGLENAQIHKIENSYPSAARNHGALLATGDALFFLDDDNVLAPRTLESFLNAIQAHDIVQSFYQIFHGDSAPHSEKSETLSPKKMGLCYGFAGLLPGAGLFFNILGNSSFMIRRDRFLSLEGFTTLYGVGLEDYSFLLKCSQEAALSWVMLPEPYLYFRLHGDKIRNSHVDWRSPFRLQAGQWRLIQDLSQKNLRLSPAGLSYARQLHELTHFHHIQTPRPKFFRLKSILVHQYIRPALARHVGLRKLFRVFMGKESRLAKWLEKIM